MSVFGGIQPPVGTVDDICMETPGLDLSYAEAEMFERMLEFQRNAANSSEDPRQYLLGFVRIIMAAAAGDQKPQKDYLDIVVPGLKEHGFPYVDLVDAMSRVSTAAILSVRSEHAHWLNDFLADHTVRLYRAWHDK